MVLPITLVGKLVIVAVALFLVLGFILAPGKSFDKVKEIIKDIVEGAKSMIGAPEVEQRVGASGKMLESVEYFISSIEQMNEQGLSGCFIPQHLTLDPRAILRIEKVTGRAETSITLTKGAEILLNRKVPAVPVFVRGTLALKFYDEYVLTPTIPFPKSLGEIKFSDLVLEPEPLFIIARLGDARDLLETEDYDKWKWAGSNYLLVKSGERIFGFSKDLLFTWGGAHFILPVYEANLEEKCGLSGSGEEKILTARCNNRIFEKLRQRTDLVCSPWEIS